MPKKGSKPKKSPAKSEEEVKIVVKVAKPKKVKPPPKFDPVASLKLYEEMKNNLVTYLEEVKDNDNNEGLSEYAIFKNNFYPKFETVLKQIDVVRDEEQKNEQINRVYAWYTEKINEFTNINPIRVISKKPAMDESPDIRHKIEFKNKTWEAQTVLHCYRCL